MDLSNESLKNDVNTNNLHSLDQSSEEGVVVVVNGECERDDDDDESESQSLLHNSQENGLSEKSGKPRRKVQWLDNNGDSLTEIFVFEPSDSDEEDEDSCMCRIM